MKAEFWLQRWEANEIGFHQEAFNSHLQNYWQRLGLAEGGRVFVPLCGKSRDMLWLLGQGHSITGVELSPIAVRDFFAENGLRAEVEERPPMQRWQSDELQILLGDFFHLEAEDLADVAGVFDRASLVALPPEMRRDYVRHLRAILPAAACILLVTMDYPQAEMGGPPFAISEAEVESLYADHYAIERLCVFDVLAENPRFRERGLSRMEERVYLLTPRA